MDKKTFGIIGVIVAAFLVLVGVSMSSQSGYNYDGYDVAKIIPADDATGNFPEMIEGSEDAKVVIIEYANYQCTACASMNPKINELLSQYKDNEVALVFRNMSLDDHTNGTASASAALAASKQGYWKEYKDYLFANQMDWFYSESVQRQKQFEEYFMQVSDNKGDLEQFVADMGSRAVQQKLKFDDKMAAKAGAEWTPYYTIDGELISQRNTSDFIGDLKKKIDEKLQK